MASGNDKKEPGGQRREKRPVKPRTIDLEAEHGDAGAAPAEANVETEQGRQEPAEDAGTSEAAAATEERAGSDDLPPEEIPPGSEEATPQEEWSEDAAAASSDASATEPEPPETAPRRGRTSVAALGLAGLIGGAIALAVFVALQTADLLPTGGDPGLRDGLAAVEARLTALEQEEAPAVVDPEEITALADDLASLEAQIADIPREPADLSGLEDRVAALEEAQQDAVPEDIIARLDDLEDRVSAIGSELENIAPADAAGGISSQLDALEAGLNEARDAQEALEQRVAEIAEVAEGSSVAEQDIARAAAGAIAFSGLARAMDAGRPYVEELTALQPLVDDPARIENLSAHAEDGLPTTRELATEFERLAPDILEAGEDAGSQDGLLNRLGAGVRSLVRVRQVAPVEGDDRAAIVSRIEAALTEGDLAGAREEWETLDGAAREVSADWAERMGNRLDAEDELGTLTAETAATVAETAGNDG